MYLGSRTTSLRSRTGRSIADMDDGDLASARRSDEFYSAWGKEAFNVLS